MAQTESPIMLLEAEGPLTPVMVEYVERGLALAERRDAGVVIFQINTPGGQVDHMSRMIEAIRASDVPVVVYVAPRGAMAASAGLMIVLSGHAAAMAPETALGAASPVGGQGEDLSETIEAKQKEMLKATARTLAGRRGEEAVTLAEAAIDEAKAASSEEALEIGLIDFIAEDLEDLLRQLDGFRVPIRQGWATIHTQGLERIDVPQNFIEEFLHTLTNPNLVFILLTVGVQAILIEISSPGGWVAGFIGVVCLALGTYGLGVLPVNWFGLIFLLTAFVLFFLDIKAPTHGALTAAGVASFIVGALVLFNSPGTPQFQRVSVPLVVIAGLFTAGAFIGILTFALRAQRRRVSVGKEALIGSIGRAKTDLSPQGMVHVAGELWSAELESGLNEIKAGERVEVVDVVGLRVRVRPHKSSPS
jgi:membrane-bound serine protease (ClpP class)